MLFLCGALYPLSSGLSNYPHVLQPSSMAPGDDLSQWCHDIMGLWVHGSTIKPLKSSSRYLLSLSTVIFHIDSNTQVIDTAEGRVQGWVTWVMTLPLGPGPPQACQGHHRPSRGTTELRRDTTGLPGAPQVCQGHHLSSRGTRGITGLLGAPQSLPGAPVHHRPVRGTTGLAQNFQGTRILVRGTTGLPKRKKKKSLEKKTENRAPPK